MQGCVGKLTMDRNHNCNDGEHLHVRRSVRFHLTHHRAGALWGSPQISTTDRTHARTGPDKQRAQAHNHTRNPDAPHVHTHTHTRTSRHITSGSATPTRERSRQGNHRLRDLHRPLRRRLRPLPPLLLHLPLPVLRLCPFPVRTLLDRCTPQAGVQ